MFDVFFYLAVFALVFIIQTIAMRCKNEIIKKWLVIFSFTIILLLIGLRYQVGSDYDSYLSMYNIYANSTTDEIWAKKTDVGTKIIFGFMPNIFSDAKIIFWIYGFLALYPIYKLNKNSNFKYLAYSTLVFNLVILPICLNGIRQGAAMSFALLAFDYLRNNPRIIKSLVCILIAIMLHTSALLMLPFLIVYIYAKRRNKNFGLLALIVTVLVAIALTTFLKDALVENDFYGNILASSSGGINVNWFIRNIMYYGMLLLFVLFMYKRNKVRICPEDDSIKDTFSMVLSGMILNAISSSAMYLYRISWYFSIYQIILVPTILQNIANKNTRVLSKIVFISVLIILFILDYYIKGYHQIIPYKTWLFM